MTESVSLGVVADIGATHARFAVATRTASGAISLDAQRKLLTADYPTFEAAFGHYRNGLAFGPRRAVLAVARPTVHNEVKLTILPGVSTAGDILRGLELGPDHFKFFPAEASGGIPTLKALCAPFYECRFCPTGGITENRAPEWLALPGVMCVGGSWLVPAGVLDIEAVHERAKAASRLAKRG